MFSQYKRRSRNGIWKHGLYYISIVIVFFLFVNLMTFQRQSASLEGENNVDPGGTSFVSNLGNSDIKYKVILQRKLHSRKNQQYVFKNSLRKLLGIMESNLENMAANVSSENNIPFERYFPDHLLDCDDISNISGMTCLASGWIKAVYKGTYKRSPVAIKTVDVTGQDVTTCMGSGKSQTACYVKAAKKIVKEIVVLQALAGENLLKVLGFCLPRNADDSLRVAMVTELGEAVDLIKLLQMSWEDRLKRRRNFTLWCWIVFFNKKVCFDITRIINFMSQTPCGPMSMNDFRRQQFVLVDGSLKLSDVDDTGVDDPACQTIDDCDIKFSSANVSQRTMCHHGRCVQYNEKKNLFNAGRHFVNSSFPTVLLHVSNQSLPVLLKDIRISPNYKKLKQSDFPGQHDYRCRLSLSMATCTVSVFDLCEAEDVCYSDVECKDFVVKQQKTWTGRHLIHLKNGVGPPSVRENTTLYIKPAGT